MALTEQEKDLYFDLWIPFLDYCNQKRNIIPGIKIKKDMPGLANTPQFKELSESVLVQPEIVDDYISQNKRLSAKEKRILQEFTRGRRGPYVVNRYVKDGAILISEEDKTVYRVEGLKSNWRELIYFRNPPFRMYTTLFPFLGTVITDGVVVPEREALLTSTVNKEYDELYRKAKQEGTIITSF